MSQAKKTRLEFIDPTSNSFKFYEITTTPDNQVTTRWGRIGSIGQTKTYTYASKWAAQEKNLSLANNKLRKGYFLVVEEALSVEAVEAVEENEKIIAENRDPTETIEVWMADF
jgi:predicted DNA-binding WGR domain protein